MTTAQIADAISKELGFEDLADSDKKNILERMMELLFKRITLRVIGQLPEGAEEEFDALQKKGDPQALHQFLSEKIPGYEAMVTETIAEFKKEMRETAAEVRGLK